MNSSYGGHRCSRPDQASLSWHKSTIAPGNIYTVCVYLIMYAQACTIKMAPEINEPPLIRDQNILSGKIPDHSWGSDPTRTLLCTSLGWSPSPFGFSWLTQPDWLPCEASVTSHCPPPFLLVGFFFLSKGGENTPCLLPKSLHLMCNRLVFAGKAENYKEGLIDPPVSLQKPVCGL